jgi:hypothetical protein
MNDAVVEAEITMHQRGLAGRWSGIWQPVHQPVHVGDLARFGGLVLLRPARNLPGDVTFRLAEVSKAGRLIAGRVQVGHEAVHGR